MPAAAAVASMPRSSPLTSLPAELRNIIYSHAVVEQKPVPVWQVEGDKVSLRAKQPALANTCRSLRREILPIYYGQNAFFAGAHTDAKKLETLM